VPKTLRLFFDLNSSMSRLVSITPDKKSACLEAGNICNLACATCSPGASTYWQKISGMPINKDDNLNAINLNRISSLDDLDFINLSGGEPLLHKDLIPLVEKLASNGIDVGINMNATVKPTQQWINALNLIGKERLSVMFSVDGIGERFNYLRWPGNWEKAVETINFVTQNINAKFLINQVVSPLTYHCYTEVKDWAISSNLPIESVNVTHMHGNCNVERFDRVDRIRGTNWRVTFPEAVDNFNSKIDKTKFNKTFNIT
jgi:MoaA/NifB/PqqE/SkfB family radical SAM enzyme